MKQAIILFLKGLAVGAANVIPGVSGGTIALVTGIYEKLIFSLKSFDLDAIKLVFSGKIKEAWQHVNGTFLFWIFAGVGVSLISLAKLFKILLQEGSRKAMSAEQMTKFGLSAEAESWMEIPNKEEIWLYAFFFGLILVSIWSVGRTVSKWNLSAMAAFVIGTGIAIALAILQPASENASFLYLMLCGAVAICSMILPGLSGSFVLILMGNYKLVMVDAVSDFNMEILLPVAIGAGVGLIAFARVLAWVFKHYRDVTIASLTGFVMGSLLIIWPWKEKATLAFGEKSKVIGYEWYLPSFDTTVMIALALMIGGGIAIWAMERFAAQAEADEAEHTVEV